MTLIETITILVCLSAGFSYLNQRYIRMPVTIGLMAIALAMSLVLLLLGKLGDSAGVIRSVHQREPAGAGLPPLPGVHPSRDADSDLGRVARRDFRRHGAVVAGEFLP